MEILYQYLVVHSSYVIKVIAFFFALVSISTPFFLHTFAIKFKHIQRATLHISESVLVVALLTVFMSVYRLSVPFQCFTHCVLSSCEATEPNTQKNIGSNDFLYEFILLCSNFSGSFSFSRRLLMGILCANLFDGSRNWKLKLFNSFFFLRFSISNVYANSTTVKHYRSAGNVAPSSRTVYRDSRRKR